MTKLSSTQFETDEGYAGAVHLITPEALANYAEGFADYADAFADYAEALANYAEGFAITPEPFANYTGPVR